MGRSLAALGSPGWLRRVELAPLSRSETAAQIAAIRGTQPSYELVLLLYERSGGNPFFAEELLAADPVAASLPSTVRSAVLSRFDRLDAGARTVAHVVAVAGPRVRRSLLLAAVELPAAALDAAVGRLVSSAVIASWEGGYEFRHCA